MLRRICDHESLSLWAKHELTLHGFDIQLAKSLTPFYVNIVNSINFNEELIDKIVMLDPDSAESLLSPAIIIEMEKSVKWQKEKGKMTKKNLGIKTERLEPVYVQTESRIFKTLLSKLRLQDTGDLRILSLASKISMRVLAKLQSDFKDCCAELDFFSRSVTVEVIEFLIQIIIASPDSYQIVIKVLSDIMFVQPKEAMTQNALNQVIAITTATGSKILSQNFLNT